jgi:acetyl-CoA carboxylase beta subunit
MQEIQFFCRKCKKSLKITYILTGNDNAQVLPNVMIKCQHCKRVMYLKKYTEKMLIEGSVDAKFYI